MQRLRASMDNDFPTPDDPRLSKLLQSWKVESFRDPRLVSRVWSRIDATETPARRRWLGLVGALFAKPLVAFAAVALFAAGGAGLAYLQNSRHEEARFDRLAREYVRSIDPIQLAASPGSAPSHHHGP